MHELSITEHLLEDCIREARAQNAVRIRVIRLCIEGARIESETLPVKVHCLDCQEDGEITPHQLKCPHCGSMRLKLLSGKEFYIKSLEVDIDGDQSTASGNGLE